MAERRRSVARDDHTIHTDRFIAGYLGTLASSFTFAWLASHRDRMHTLVLGLFGRITITVSWDTKGVRERVGRDEADLAAIYQLVYGSEHV